MDGSRGHGYKLSRSHHNLPILKFNDQFAIHPEKRFIRRRMLVPAELLGHDAHPYLVIVHFAERHIFVSCCHCSAKRQGIYKGGRVSIVGHAL